MAVLGIGLAFVSFFPWTVRSGRSALLSWHYNVAELWLREWGFDQAYDRLFVRPWLSFTSTTGDAIDRAYQGFVEAINMAHEHIVRTQTGLVRWYAATLAVGALVLLGFVIGWQPR
jgi:NADH-quinone oxidoreductase subunit L